MPVTTGWRRATPGTATQLAEAKGERSRWTSPGTASVFTRINGQRRSTAASPTGAAGIAPHRDHGRRAPASEQAHRPGEGPTDAHERTEVRSKGAERHRSADAPPWQEDQLDAAVGQQVRLLAALGADEAKLARLEAVALEGLGDGAGDEDVAAGAAPGDHDRPAHRGAAARAGEQARDARGPSSDLGRRLDWPRASSQVEISASAARPGGRC